MKFITETALAIITIWQEARGESYDGKLAVAEVIRNRMRNRYSSDGTISGTVLRRAQFSGWDSHDPNLMVSLRLDDGDSTVKECAKAWEDATENETNVAKGAVLYANLNIVSPGWAKKCVQVAKVGAHTFFVEH